MILTFTNVATRDEAFGQLQALRLDPRVGSSRVVGASGAIAPN